MAKSASNAKIVLIVGLIIAAQVAVYALLIVSSLSFKRFPLPHNHRWVAQFGWRQSKAGFVSSGDRAYFSEYRDGRYFLKEIDLGSGDVSLSLAAEQGPFKILVQDGETLFFYSQGDGLFRRGAGDGAWSKVAPPLSAVGEVRLTAAGGEAFAFVENEGSGDLFRWHPRQEGWESLASLKNAGKARDPAKTGFHRIGDDLLLFSSICPEAGSCYSGSAVFPEQKLFLYSLRSKILSEAPPSWGNDPIQGAAGHGGAFLLLGIKSLYRFDAAKRTVVEVAPLAEIFESSSYSTHIKEAGAVIVGAGDQIYFFDEELQQLMDPLPLPKSGVRSVRYWYDTSEQNRVLVRGDKAFLQVMDEGRGGLGYFRRTGGAWTYAGFLEEIQYVVPLDVSERGLLYGDEGKISLLPFGFEACATSDASASRAFPGSNDSSSRLLAFWAGIVQELSGSFVRGRVARIAPDLCRFDLEYSFLGGKRSETVGIAGRDAGLLKNFLNVQDGDLVTVPLKRAGFAPSAGRIFIESRGGRPVEGQAPIYHAGFAWLSWLFAAAAGLGFWSWGMRSLSVHGPEALRGVFPEEKAVAASRLRTVGFAVLGLAVLFLVQKAGGRPYDLREALEGFCLKLGAFLVGFAVIYYVGALNLVGLYRRRAHPS